MKTTTPRLSASTIDFAYEGDDFAEDLERLAREYDVGVKVYKAQGPAGGAPEVYLFGTADDMERAVREMWASGDADEDEWLVRGVVHGKP